MSTTQACKEKLRQDYWPTLVTELIIWPPYQARWALLTFTSWAGRSLHLLLPSCAHFIRGTYGRCRRPTSLTYR